MVFRRSCSTSVLHLHAVAVVLHGAPMIAARHEKTMKIKILCTTVAMRSNLIKIDDPEQAAHLLANAVALLRGRNDAGMMSTFNYRISANQAPCVAPGVNGSVLHLLTP